MRPSNLSCYKCSVNTEVFRILLGVVHVRQCHIGLGPCCKSYEAKTAAPVRVTVFDDDLDHTSAHSYQVLVMNTYSLLHRSILLEAFAQGVIGRVPGQASLRPHCQHTDWPLTDSGSGLTQQRALPWLRRWTWKSEREFARPPQLKFDRCLAVGIGFR